MLFVGWDWASESHDVAVLDEDATTVDRWALGHGAEGIGDALARLARLGSPGSARPKTRRSRSRRPMV